MIQSPCRDCPNRWLDKKFCAGSCNRLIQFQILLATHMAPVLSSAVNYEDEGRYRVAMIDENRLSGGSESLL